MKKILIFSLNYFPKYVGGAEVAIKEIVERQDKNKYEFHMVTLRFDSNLPRYEVLHGIHIHRIGFTKKGATISDIKKFPLHINKYYFQLFGAFYAIYFHYKYDFDAVWAMMAHSCGIPAGIFKMFDSILWNHVERGRDGNKRLVYILTLQEGDPPEHIEKLAKPFPTILFPLNRISFWFFKNAFKRADILQTISTFLLNWGRKMGMSGEAVVIPNAVDVKKFTAPVSQQEKEKIKLLLEKKEDQKWLITTSRLVHKNAVDDCIRAIKILKDKNKNYHFAILGIGPEEEKYKKLAKDLDIEDRVKFVGEVKHESMLGFLKVCDIFIRPSRSEGMGNSFVEAMAAELPVIATREGGLSDFIFDGQTAFVCEKDNPESIVSAVEKIENFKMDGKLENVLRTASEMVKEKYDWDKIAGRMDKEVFSKI